MEKMQYYHLGECQQCQSRNTGVWKDRKNWFIVGCRDCRNHTYVDAASVKYTVQWWKDGRCGE